MEEFSFFLFLLIAILLPILNKDSHKSPSSWDNESGRSTFDNFSDTNHSHSSCDNYISRDYHSDNCFENDSNSSGCDSSSSGSSGGDSSSGSSD